VFENWVLRRIFGLKGEEATEEWRKLHNEKLDDLYCSPNVIGVIKSRTMMLLGHVVRMGERKGLWRGMVGKHEGKRLLRRSSHRREDNFKMDIQEMGWGDMDWINLAKDKDRWLALVKAVMNHRVP
jgi:hypothetical protein